MFLELYWKDKDEKEYHLANLLKKENDLFILDIIEQELKKALQKGCYGIGNINFLSNHYESKELYSFFKDRIPLSNNPRISDILKKYNLKQYDEIALLSKTKGLSNNDNYYIKIKNS